MTGRGTRGIIIAPSQHSWRRVPIPAESPPPLNERNLALQLAELLAATIDLVYPPGTLVRRDAHPKHHAVVRGELVVTADVPDDLKHGVFATAGRVPAWIRFSNGAPLRRTRSPARSTRLRDQAGRRPGPKLLDSERDAVTQDFLLASAKCFFLRDASDYVGFARAAAKKPAFRILAFFFGWNPWKWRGHEFRALVGGLTRARDLLALWYWSQVPYQLGPHVVKYALTPIDPPPLPPDSRSPDFLRERLASHLAAHPARFAFSHPAPTESGDDADRGCDR